MRTTNAMTTGTITAPTQRWQKQLQQKHHILSLLVAVINNIHNNYYNGPLLTRVPWCHQRCSWIERHHEPQPVQWWPQVTSSPVGRWSISDNLEKHFLHPTNYGEDWNYQLSNSCIQTNQLAANYGEATNYGEDHAALVWDQIGLFLRRQNLEDSMV